VWFIIEDAKIEPWHFRTRAEVIRFVWWAEWHKGQTHPKTYTLDEILARNDLKTFGPNCRCTLSQVEVMQPVMGFKHNSKGQLEQTFKMKAEPSDILSLDVDDPKRVAYLDELVRRGDVEALTDLLEEKFSSKISRRTAKALARESIGEIPSLGDMIETDFEYSPFNCKICDCEIETGLFATVRGYYDGPFCEDCCPNAEIPTNGRPKPILQRGPDGVPRPRNRHEPQ